MLTHFYNLISSLNHNSERLYFLAGALMVYFFTDLLCVIIFCGLVSFAACPELACALVLTVLKYNLMGLKPTMKHDFSQVLPLLLNHFKTVQRDLEQQQEQLK